MFKIHKTKGNSFKFENHINEFLIPREAAKASETFLVIIKPNKGSHMHKHPDQEQTFYIIKGSGEIWTKNTAKGVSKRFCSIKTGDLVFVPINNWHQIKTTGKTNLEYICFNSFPKGFPKGEKTSLAHALNVRKMQLTK